LHALKVIKTGHRYYQLIGFKEKDSRALLTFENGWDLKKPLYDESGLGWGEVCTKCFDSSISDLNLCAYAPQRIKHTFFLLIFTALISSKVTSSQPQFLCDAALPEETVNTEFNNRTP
jgi:hypothetical protein